MMAHFEASAFERTDADWPGASYDTELRWASELGRRLPAKDRHVSYRPAQVPLIAALDVPVTREELSQAFRAERVLREADEGNILNPSTVPLLRSESAASSKIEQIEVKQRYVARALAGYPVKQRSAREVAANVAALQLALDLADDLSPQTVDQIHATLLPDVEWAGRVRDVQNWIGGSDYSPLNALYVPPRPEDVAALVADLCQFARRDDLPPLVQAAVVHGQFEAIHPYPDGNGRVGRALVHAVLKRRGVVTRGIAPLSIAVLGHRDTYFDALRHYDQGQVGIFVSHFAASSNIAARASRRLISDLAAIRQDWSLLPEVAGARSDALVHHLVADLIEHPVTDAGALAERHGASHESARRALETLRKADVLRRTTAARNLQLYEAWEVFDALDTLEKDISTGNLG